MKRLDVIDWMRRRARACRDRGAAAGDTEAAYAHYDEQVRFERAAALLRQDVALVSGLAAVVKKYRHEVYSSECLPDGSVPDPNAARDILQLDRLIAAAAAYEGDQASSSSSPAPTAGGVDGVA